MMKMFARASDTKPDESSSRPRQIPAAIRGFHVGPDVELRKRFTGLGLRQVRC